MTTPDLTPDQKKLVEAAQGMIDRRVARLGALSATLTTTNRIITGRRDLAVKFRMQGVPFHGNLATTPAYTDGKTIAINDAMLPDIRTKSGLVTTLGLNYHELAHNLYTPGSSSNLSREVRAAGLDATFNLLEDARIESLLVAKYRSAAKFLSAPVLEFIIKDEHTWPTAHLYTHGRRFLPKEVRKELRDVFQGDATMRAACEDIIDRYRKMDLSYERTHAEALQLIKALDDIINNQLMGCLSQEEQEAMGQHGACGGIGNRHGQFDNKLMEIREDTKDASRRLDEDDAAQEAEEGGDDGDDTEDEDGTEEQPQGDSGDVDDDPEDDGDDTEAESSEDVDDAEDIEDEDDEDDEGGDGWDDSEDDIDEEDDEDGLSGDEPEGDDESDEGGSEGGPSGGGPGDVGDDGDASGDASDDLTGDAEGGGSAAGVGGGSLDDLADALAAALEELEGDSEIDSEVTRLQQAMDDDNLMDTILPEIPYQNDPVTAQAAQSASMVIRELQKLNTAFEAGWDYGTDHGRLNTQRAMTAEWGDMDIFDHWEEGREQDAAVEAVVLVDRSSSMTPYAGADRMRPACNALWVIKRALDEVDGLSTVCTFDSDIPQKLYGRGEKADPNMIRQVKSSGGTIPRNAFNEARRVMNLSERPNKVFAVITDGEWQGDTEENLRILKATKGTRVYIGIDKQIQDEYREAFDVIAVIHKPEDIAEVMRRAVVSMLDEAIKRR